MADSIPVNNRIVLPASDITVETMRSGGPGGQHANTSDTRVRLRFALDATDALPPPVKERIRERFPSQVTKDGELLVTSGSERSQLLNLEEARERLADIVRTCLAPPRKRKPTRPTRGSKERRLKHKKARKQVKRLRGKVGRQD